MLLLETQRGQEEARVLMAASVLISVAGDGGLLGLYGPREGQRAFLRVPEAWREACLAKTRERQGWV